MKLPATTARCLGANFNGKPHKVCPVRETCLRYTLRYKGDRHTPVIEGGAEDDEGGCGSFIREGGK